MNENIYKPYLMRIDKIINEAPDVITFQLLFTNEEDKKNFELEKPQQIIHNYNMTGLVDDSKNLCNNLIVLVEFMLESEQNFLKSIDLGKLK